MPEYPEIKVYAENLTARLAGQTVTASWGAPFDCAGRTLERVDSHGKKLRFVFTDKSAFAVHLMLAGEFVFLPADEAKETAGVKLRLEFGADALLVTDLTGYAKIGGQLDIAVPEPTAQQLKLEYFRKLFSGRRAVKTVLCDQKAISGIGNAYADEMLYRAGVHPASRACALPDAVVERLHAAVIEVMAFAVREFGLHAPGAIAGERREWLDVHVPGRKTTDKDEAIEVIEIGGRKTYFASSQRLYV